jgi:hypothetical protein
VEAWRKEFGRELAAARGERAIGLAESLRLDLDGETLALLGAVDPSVARAVVAFPWSTRPTRTLVERRLRRAS